MIIKIRSLELSVRGEQEFATGKCSPCGQTNFVCLYLAVTEVQAPRINIIM
jgi:hypothetical protein